MSAATVSNVRVIPAPRRALASLPSSPTSERAAAYLRHWRTLGYTGSYVPEALR